MPDDNQVSAFSLDERCVRASSNCWPCRCQVSVNTIFLLECGVVRRCPKNPLHALKGVEILQMCLDDIELLQMQTHELCGHHMPSALASASHACPSAATGLCWSRLALTKNESASELVNGDGCRLVVVDVETRGRWSDEAVTFLDLASDRAREAPPMLWACGDVVSCACLQLHAGERLHCLWFLPPRVPHLTLLTCAVGSERSAHPFGGLVTCFDSHSFLMCQKKISSSRQ